MLFEVLRNRVRPPSATRKALAEFTDAEARKTGMAFANALLANTTPVAAVDEWVIKYPALGELEEEYSWLRATMNAVAAEILGGVAWGAKLRAYLGAVISFADILSDA